MQTREGVLTMLDTATCGASAAAGMACGALTVATAATRRTFASGRNLRMTCSFLVRFRSAAAEEAHDAPYNSRCAPPLAPCHLAHRLSPLQWGGPETRAPRESPGTSAALDH